MKTSFDAMSPAELRGLLVEAVAVVRTLNVALVVVRDLGGDGPFAGLAEEALRLGGAGEFAALALGGESARRVAAETGETG
jgi:hypothetical protein